MCNGREYPLTGYQKDIWLQQYMYPDLPLFNIGGYFEFRGSVDIALLRDALRKLIINNDSLRITYTLKGGEVVQRITDDIIMPIIMRDYSRMKDAHLLSLRWMKRRFCSTFDLLNGKYAYELAIIKVRSDLVHVFIKSHHIVMDGWSFSLFYRKLCEYYNKTPEVHGEAYSYLELISREQNYLQSEDYINDIRFWGNFINRSKGSEQIYPGIIKYAQNSSKKSTIVGCKIPKTRIGRITELTNQLECSEYQFFLSLMCLYFAKLLNKHQLVVGMPVLNRTNHKERQTLGLYANALPLVIDVDMDKPFENLVTEVKGKLRQAYRHYRLPFGEILNSAPVLRDSGNNIFDFTLSYIQLDDRIDLKSCSADITMLHNGYERFPASVYIKKMIKDGSVKIEFSCQKDMYDKAFQAENLTEHIIQILEETIAKTAEAIGEVEFISKTETEKIINEFNSYSLNIGKNTTVVDLFEKKVKSDPRKIAIEFGDKSISYAELNNRANNLGKVLREYGIGPDKLVGIMIDPSIEMITGVLGILKAGGAYVPIDPQYPASRNQYIIGHSEIGILLTQKDLVQKVDFKGKWIFIEDHINHCSSESNLEKTYSSENLFSVHYTSGSTGVPKGVMLTHKGMANMGKWFEKGLKIRKKDRVAQIGSLSFDASTYEIFMSILTGATVVIPTREEIYDFRKFEEFLNNKVISVTLQIPNYLANINPQNVNSLRLLITGGASLPEYLVDLWKDKADAVINTYGPTETTIYSTEYICRKNRFAETVPIGKPLFNERIYILNEWMKLQPIGVPGEIYIAGDGVTRGYLKDSKLTDEKFMDDPYYKGSRMYKTGDVGRWLPDGTVEFLGRVDRMVKVRGFRVELPEIENCILKFPGIKNCAVVMQRDESIQEYLIAYFDADEPVNNDALRTYASQKLPHYMIPTYFAQFSSLPLMPNGKIDYNAIPAFDRSMLVNEGVSEEISELEEKLCKAFAACLGVEYIHSDNDFFSYGGHSIAAMKLCANINKDGINITINDIFEGRTPRGIAARLESDSTCQLEVSKSYPKVQTGEWSMPGDDKGFTPRNILLTGGTGFLGSHILEEILNNSSLTAYILIRGESEENCKARLCSIMHSYFGTRYDYLIERNVNIIKGDFCEHNLGLPDGYFEKLMGEIDLIIHAGALVKHFGNYSDFQRINIDGTKRLVDIAAKYDIHLAYASTISIMGDYSGNNKKFDESDFFLGQEFDRNWYMLSKYEAENTAIEAIAANKAKVSILRLGNLMCRYSDGVFQTNWKENAFCRVMGAIRQMGIVPDEWLDWGIEVTPTDLCSKAVMSVITNESAYGQAFHVYNPNFTSMKNILKEFGKLGTHITPVPYKSFIERAKEIVNGSDKDSPVMWLVNYAGSSANPFHPQWLQIENLRTIEYLRHVGFEWPCIDTEYLSRVLSYTE
ncbi:MAG: amino acid adenylation domain-containing protein [Clostridia bacterium]|nr:amino acid adenylation domain-containing protein [Clostridia bacterium]